MQRDDGMTYDICTVFFCPDERDAILQNLLFCQLCFCLSYFRSRIWKKKHPFIEFVVGSNLFSWRNRLHMQNCWSYHIHHVHPIACRISIQGQIDTAQQIPRQTLRMAQQGWWYRTDLDGIGGAYCWWFRDQRKPVEGKVVEIYHDLQVFFFLHF